MKIKTIISLILAGGLIALLAFLVTFKQVAYVSFEDGQFKVEKQWGIVDSIVKNKELPSKLELDPSLDVEEVILGDFTNNGTEDVGIYLWKEGNYGDSLPFWVEENDKSYQQHLFIIERTGKQSYKSVWNSSNLPYINMKTYLTDLDKDGLNEIVVLEKPYGKAQKTVAIWQWDNWGFKNIWRSESGNFSDLKLK